MRSKVVALIAALVAIALHAPPAAAQVSTPIVAGPGAFLATSYVTAVAVTTVGGELTFLNADLAGHDVVSVQKGPDDQPWCEPYQEGACPILWSPMIFAGQTTAVLGTENLEVGEIFEFYCQPHSWMRGNLVVVPG